MVDNIPLYSRYDLLCHARYKHSIYLLLYTRMKKLLGVGVLVSSSFLSAHAQHIRFGVRAGATLATATGPDAQDGERLWGPLAGVVMNLPLTTDGFFSLQPELSYSRKGYYLTRPSFTAPAKIRFEYLTLPVLAKLKVSGLVLEAGPQLGYLLGVRDYLPTLTRDMQMSRAPYRHWEVSYVAGVGYELQNGLGVGVRYNAALTRVRLLSNPIDPARFYHAAFQFQLSYLLPRS